MPDLLSQAVDLPSFRVVPPNKAINPEDVLKSTLPDGTRMVGPDGLLIPAARSFSAIVNAGTRVFSYRFDEAMRDNFVNARAMRRDAFLRGLIEERILPTINRRWHLEVDDDTDPDQVFVRDALTKVIESIPNFDAFKRAALDGVWFGRTAIQWAYTRDWDNHGYWGFKKFDPIHGDSVQFSFDGHPAILMDTMTAAWYTQNGATNGWNGDIRPTDRGGMALVLQRPIWRDRFLIHQHMLEKADFFEGELAGSVQGLGLRGLVYWQYVIRTDALTWMLAYMQAVGQMDMLVFNFPAGDAAAEARQIQNANKIIGKAAIVCPRNPTGNWPAVEQIQMNAAGLKAMQELVADYFDRHIERLIVGQSMSAGADKGTGLGGTGRAEFTKATKDEILVYDTNRLDESMTNDVVTKLKKYNFKWAKFPVRFKSILPDLEAAEKVQNGATLISAGVAIKADEFREAAGYSRPEEGDELVGAPPPPMGPAGMPPGADPAQMMAFGSGAPPEGPPPGAGGPPMLPAGPGGTPFGSARQPIRNMGYPGGSNTFIPSFGGPDKKRPGHDPKFTRFTRIGSSTPYFAHQTEYVTDSGGREHKDAGPGGGQFTNKDDIPGFPGLKTKVVDLPGGAKSHEIHRDGNKVFHLAGFEESSPDGPVFHTDRAHAFDDSLRGTGLAQKFLQHVADSYPGGLKSRKFQTSGSYESALRKLPTYSEDEENHIIRPTGDPRSGMGVSPVLDKLPEGYQTGSVVYPGAHKAQAVVSELANRSTKSALYDYIVVKGEGGYRVARAPSLDKIKKELEHGHADRVPPELASLIRNERGENPTVYKDGPSKFCSTQVNLTGYAAIKILEYGQMVPDNLLAKDGREMEPHVTLRYGLHDPDPNPAARLIKDTGPIKIKLGKVGVFKGEETGKDYDVIKAEVTSPGLRFLNRKLGKLKNTETFKYNPHATIAYVKKGYGEQLAKQMAPIDWEFEVDTVVFSDTDHAHTLIPLAEPPTTYARYDRLPGGKGDNRPDSAFDPEQLRAGIQIEMEHTTDPRLAKEIAKDHLSESGDYYRKLSRMEREDYKTDQLGNEHKEAGPGGGQFTSKGNSGSGADTSAQPPPEPASPSGKLDRSSREAFINSAAESLSSVPGIDEEESAFRAECVKKVMARIPPKVLNQLAKSTLRGVVGHYSKEEVTNAYYYGEPSKDGTKVVGFYDAETGTLEMNGGDVAGTYAHEVGHAIDSTGADFDLSDSDEFRMAWARELKRGQLSEYGGTNEAEGFAEFCRFLYSQDNAAKYAAELFPMTTAFFERNGLMPGIK